MKTAFFTPTKTYTFEKKKKYGDAERYRRMENLSSIGAGLLHSFFNHLRQWRGCCIQRKGLGNTEVVMEAADTNTANKQEYPYLYPMLSRKPSSITTLFHSSQENIFSSELWFPCGGLIKSMKPIRLLNLTFFCFIATFIRTCSSDSPPPPDHPPGPLFALFFLFFFFFLFLYFGRQILFILPPGTIQYKRNVRIPSFVYHGTRDGQILPWLYRIINKLVLQI